MNTIHHIHLLISILAAGACALLVSAATVPAAVAGTDPIPEPAGYVGDPISGPAPSRRFQRRPSTSLAAAAWPAGRLP